MGEMGARRTYVDPVLVRRMSGWGECADGRRGAAWPPCRHRHHLTANLHLEGAVLRRSATPAHLLARRRGSGRRWLGRWLGAGGSWLRKGHRGERGASRDAHTTVQPSRPRCERQRSTQAQREGHHCRLAGPRRHPPFSACVHCTPRFNGSLARAAMRASVAPVLLCVLGVGLVWQPCLAFDVEGGRPAARPGSPQQPPRTALATAQPTTVAGIEERERERREGERECVRERERARARESAR